MYGWKTTYGWEYRKDGDKNNNTQYVGEIKDRKPHGKGTFNYLNGNKYIGEFDEYFQPHGQGTFIYSDGRKDVGKFVDGWFCSIKSYDKDGIFISEKSIDKGIITNVINYLDKFIFQLN